MNTPNLNALRKEARNLKKSHSLKTNQAQKMVAERYGFRDWRDVVSSLECQSFRFSLPKPKIYDSVPELIEESFLPTFDFVANDVMFITGAPGTAKSLLMKEASLQALQQGLNVLYLGYYSSVVEYDQVNYNDYLETHENFWPMSFEGSVKKPHMTLSENRVLDVLENLGANTLVVVDEAYYVHDRIRLESIFNKEAIFFLSNQCLQDFDIDVQGLVKNDFSTCASMLFLGSYLSLANELDSHFLKSSLGLNKEEISKAVSNLTELSRHTKCGIWCDSEKVSLVPEGKELIPVLASRLTTK